MDVRPKTGAGAQGTRRHRGKLLGQGGFGSVYECRGDSSLAIKGIRVNEHNEGTKVALEKEIEIIRKLHHRRIVQYFDTYRSGTHLYILMERMSGGSLKDQLFQHGAFNEKRSRKYTSQVLDGLECLHKEKIAHRDVKCANVLLDASDDIKLCDFGISVVLEEPTKIVTTEAGGIAGTLVCMAPELFNGVGHGRKSDIWSLGCTLVEMLTAHPPWHKLQRAAVIKNLVLGRQTMYELPAAISPATREFLGLCFTVDPAVRPKAADLKRHGFIQGNAAGNGPEEHAMTELMPLGRLKIYDHDSPLGGFGLTSPGTFLHWYAFHRHHLQSYILTLSNHSHLHASQMRMTREQLTDADIASLPQTPWWIVPQCESSCLAGLEAAYSRRVKGLQLGFQCSDDDAHSVWDRVKHGLEAQSIARLTLLTNKLDNIVSLTLGDCSSTVRSSQPRTVQDLLAHLAPSVKEMEWHSRDSHNLLGPALRALHRSTQLTGLHVYVTNHPLPTECVQALAGVARSCTGLQRWTLHQDKVPHHEDITEILQALKHRQLSCVNLTVNGKKETEEMLELFISPKDTVGVYASTLDGGVS